jgi:hypothetical protein
MTGTFIPIYVCEESLPVQELCATYAPALQELVEDLEWGTEVLPALQNIFLEELLLSGPVQ